MALSGIQSGYQILQQASHKADSAASELNQHHNRKPDLAFNNANLSAEQDAQAKANQQQQEKVSSASDADANALIKLNEAQSYNRVGANVVQRQNTMLGNLLDIQA